MVLSAEDSQQRFWCDTSAPCDTVFAVGGEDIVLWAQCASQSDLRGFLTQQWHPQAQLALALEGVAFGVNATDQHHVAVEAFEVVNGEFVSVCVEIAVGYASSVGRQHLDYIVHTHCWIRRRCHAFSLASGLDLGLSQPNEVDYAACGAQVQSELFHKVIHNLTESCVSHHSTDGFLHIGVTLLQSPQKIHLVCV